MTALAGAARLRVNAIACAGRGPCAEMPPELISLDDRGFPIIREAAVPGHVLGDARVTVRACPRLALWLERRTGAEGAKITPAGDQ